MYTLNNNFKYKKIFKMSEMFIPWIDQKNVRNDFKNNNSCYTHVFFF